MSGSSQIDAYLELQAGQKVIKGETLDAVFGEAGKNAIQVLSFELNFTKNEYVVDDDDDEVSGNLRTQIALGGSNSKASKTASVTTVLPSKKKKKKSPYSFTISKHCDYSSPKLFTFHTEYLQRPLSVSQGSQGNNTALIDRATLSFRKAGGGMVTYFVCSFANLLITEYKLDASSEHPTETVVFSFEQCEINYSPQSAHGDVLTTQKGKYGWDFGDNVPWSN